MPKLSALLIVFNEARQLPAAIDTVAFADEIIVVDSFSTDGTYQTLQQDSRVTVVQRAFVNYAEQRNYALTLANNDWVLFVDADERISPILQAEIVQTINSEAPKAAYYFYRQCYYFKQKLRFSGLQTDKIYRLFRKSKAAYMAHKIVHETLEVQGQSGILNNKLDHYFFDDYNTYKNKMISYGKLKGQELFNRGARYSWLKATLKRWYKFCTHFIIRLGFLDGKKGLVISKLNALSVKERYKELKRLQSLAPK